MDLDILSWKQWKYWILKWIYFGPNPIKDKVQLTFEKDLGKFQFTNFDLQGQIVLEAEEQGASIYVNTIDWTPGIYLFAIQSNKIQIINGRIIKL